MTGFAPASEIGNLLVGGLVDIVFVVFQARPHQIWKDESGTSCDHAEDHCLKHFDKVVFQESRSKLVYASVDIDEQRAQDASDDSDYNGTW